MESPEERFKRLDKLRKKAKVVNYSSLYGVGAAKLAREMGVSVKEAKELLEAFWELNWSIKKVAKEQYIKIVDGKTWIRNPLNGFWYSLRYEKDIWSTINQGSGTYIFDSWLARARVLGYMGQGQFHDETLASVTDESHTREVLYKAVEMLNNDLTLEVEIKIDMAFGSNYAEVH